MSKAMMKQLGFALMSLGFLAAAFFTVQHPEKVAWVPWGVATAVTALGAILLRLAQRVSASDAAEMASNIAIIDKNLALLVERISKLNRDKNESNVFEYCGRIDDDCIEAINDFVEAREAMIHSYGLATYAKLMDNFALAERSLNRAWCASADGYIDELHACIERADRFMQAAHDVVKQARGTQGSADEAYRGAK